MKAFFIQGGMFGMSVITLFLLIAIVFVVLNFKKIVLSSSPDIKWLNSIVFLGSLSFVFGIFYQILGMFQALGVIAEMGDVSPKLIMGGLKVSFIAPIYGFTIFFISSIIWYSLKQYAKYRM